MSVFFNSLVNQDKKKSESLKSQAEGTQETRDQAEGYSPNKLNTGLAIPSSYRSQERLRIRFRNQGVHKMHTKGKEVGDGAPEAKPGAACARKQESFHTPGLRQSPEGPNTKLCLRAHHMLSL